MAGWRGVAAGVRLGRSAGGGVQVVAPGLCLPCGAHLAGGGAQVAPGCGFEFVAGGGQGAPGAQRGVGAFPEAAGDVLAAGFDVGDRAAAVLGEPGELPLGASGSAAVGGKLGA
jgi:hypothetical protein